MNSDQAYDQLQNQQYTYAKNIRITKNQLVGDVDEDYSTLHEGIISPVHKGFTLPSASGVNINIGGRILGAATVDNLGVIITNYENKLRLYKFKIENDTVTYFQLWLETVQDTNIDSLNSISVVLYKELNNVIKAYIATGIWPILTVRVDDDTDPYNGNVDIDNLINNRIMPTSPIYIDGIIGGQLKTSQVQYTYRFYNKYGITTKLAPLTNKIQVIDPNRNKEVGNAEDTLTTIGFALKINYQNPNFERMQIYRLSYIKENEDAQVHLIYDGNKQNSFNDVGVDPLQVLTMEEFSSISGVQVIPSIIEHNQDYLFASNVKDDTILKNIHIDNTPQIDRVYTKIKLGSGNTNQFLPTKNENQPISNNIEGFDTTGINLSVENYLKDRNINPSLAADTYNNIFTSSLLRSLRRGEKYKYGIVYYDKYGRRSDVIALGDITMPKIYPRSPGGLINYDSQNGNILSANVFGVRIGLPQPLYQDGSVVQDIIGCQIVRRSSKDIYQNTLLQVALSRPIRQKLYKTSNGGSESQSPYYPSGYLTSDLFCTDGYYGNGSDTDDQELLQPPVEGVKTKTIRPYGDFIRDTSANNFDNKGLFQIFSAEIDFRRDDQLSKLSAYDLFLQPVQILAPIESAAMFSGNAETVFKNLTSSVKTQLGSSTTLRYSGDDDENISVTENGFFGNGDYIQSLQQQGLLKFIGYYQSVDNNDDWTCEYYTGNSDYPLYLHKRDKYHPTDQETLDQVDKIKDHLIFNYVIEDSVTDSNLQLPIFSVDDVKIPKWYEGFSNITYSGQYINGGTKQYKSYETSIDSYTFNNWVSAGLYDLQIWDENQPNTFGQYDGDSNDDPNDWATAQFLYGEDPTHRRSVEGFTMPSDSFHYTRTYHTFAKGMIGPGPSSLLMTIDENANQTDKLISGYPLGTVICNIQHSIEFQNAEPDEYTTYYGFGNYFNMQYNATEGEYYIKHNYSEMDQFMYIFDGDIYTTPHEITTLYKTYDYNSLDSLESLQITNYVPMESKVNTFFDYGMNYLNTNSSNLLYESGSIDGVTTQKRPAHQYNMIYSSNDVSNDVFSLISTDEKETNNFPHRTYYSEPKINGEFIDNFTIFKALSFIDVDSKYGQITNLLTDKNTLYYWQEHAFGKFSVNERSLINDQNGNTIMLGQAGILSRYDYASTKYGMRPDDRCAVTAEDKVYWIDINNRAIVVGNSQQAVNLGEQLNVQNIINNYISEDIPKIDYDLQNSELLCKCFEGGEQFIFNLKYNIPTSVYTRDYDDIIYIKNHIYGLKNNLFTKYNYISGTDVQNENDKFLTPVQLQFIVNPATSTTKVFDSQMIVPIKRKQYDPQETGDTFFNNLVTIFETDIIDQNNNQIESRTDREGNIIYNIPRYAGDYGNRMRGKWMKCSFEQTPHEFFTISHVITKLRQSYS